MERKELLQWAVEKCSELVDEHLDVNFSDWYNVDRPNLITHWEKSKDMFTCILCLRTTGSDLIILDQDRQIDELITEINWYIVKRNNSKFYCINPFFKEATEITPLKALSWSMYVLQNKYTSMRFKADGSVEILY